MFMRAYFYFNLVNLFGEVPLITTTDFEVNRLMPRSSINTIYEQVTDDLNESIKRLERRVSQCNSE